MLGSYLVIQIVRRNMPFVSLSLANAQYVDKNETLFNIRLSSHRKDVKVPKAVLIDQLFQKRVVIDSTIIHRLTNTNFQKKS